MEPYVNTGRKDYLKELNRVRRQQPRTGSGMYVNPNPRDIPGHANKPIAHGLGGSQMSPTDYVEYHDAGSGGELSRENAENARKKQKLHQKYQTKGKKTLLTSQPTKSKGGGKSGGGGGGKWGFFNRMRHSPWNILRNDKSF